MHPTALPPVIQPRRRSRGLAWFALGLLTCLAATVWFVVDHFTLSRDARALRNAVTAASPAGVGKRLELSLGRVVFGLAHRGFKLVPEVPPEAHSALQAVRGAEVGIYRLNQPGATGPSAVFRATDAAMTKRGWEGVLRVAHGQESLAVYVPAALRPGQPLRALVLVLREQDCVIALVRADLEPWLKLAERAIAAGMPEPQISLHLSAARR